MTPGGSLTRSAPLAAVAIFGAAFAFRYLSYAGFPNDHFVHLSRAQQMLLGAWPVRDFVDPGMPLMYAVSAAGLLGFGHNLFGEALLVFGAIALAAALTFEAARAAAGSTLAGIAAAGLETAIYPRSYSYPKLLLYAAAILMCWRCIGRPSPGRCAALGVLVAAAFLFRHDHGLFIGAAALLSLLLARVRMDDAARAVAAFAAGVLLPLLPWVVLVHATVGVPGYARSAVEFSRAEAAQTGMRWPRFEIDPSAGLWAADETPVPARALVHVRWAPGLTVEEQARRERALGLERVAHHEGRTWRYTVERDPERARALLNDPAVEDTSGIERLQIGWGEQATRMLAPVRGHPGPGLPVGQNSVALLYYAMLALPLMAGVLVLWLRDSSAPMPNAGARLAIVVLLAICTAATFLRDPLRERLADAIVPAVVLGSWLAAAAWRSVRSAGAPVRLGMRLAVLTSAGVLAASTVVVGNTREQLDRMRPFTPAGIVERARVVTAALRHDYRTVFLPGATAFDLQPAFGWLEECTQRSDRFSFVGFAPDAYFFAGRGFAGGQVAFIGEYYSSPAEQSLTVDRFRREQVPLVLMPNRHVEEFERRFPILAEYIQANFAPAGALELSAGDSARVLIDRRLRSTRTQQPLGWPCFR